MTNRPKTIQIFLPDGSPRSIKIAEITSRIAKAIQIPRSKLKDISKRDEMKNPGIYFLFGSENNLDIKKSVYIGEAENCLNRLNQHNTNKDFWNTAIALISKSNSLQKGHVKWLEWFSIKMIKKINIYKLENTATPKEPYILETVQADLMDFFDNSRILLSTLGFPVFEEIKTEENKELLYCKNKNIMAKGVFSDDGFLILQGSTANLIQSSNAPNWLKNMSNELIKNKILIEENGLLTFAQDFLFNTPSTAAGIVIGYQSNGWVQWKDKNNKTLDELMRNPVKSNDK